MSLIKEHEEPKFVAKVDPLSSIRNNKLIAQGGKLETLAKSRVFVSNISSPCLSGDMIWVFCFSYFTALRTAQHFIFHSAPWRCMCSKKFEGDLIKNLRKSLLFGYCKLGFRCLVLIYFHVASI